jgi:pyruvate/oxaloacetate carboxyltransferase
MKKLVAVREVVLRVNIEYIHSAAQADEFRTEPPFRLQGSYRNMNRLAEKVVPIMNDAEVQALIIDHYRGESQTLTTGAEANLLKFKDMAGVLSPEEKARWDEIKRTFQRNQVTRGAEGTDPMSRVVAQLASFSHGIEGIQQALQKQSGATPAPVVVDVAPLAKSFEALANSLQGKSGNGQGGEPRMHNVEHELEMLHSTLATLKDIAAQQRDHLRRAQELLEERARKGVVEIELTQEMLTNERAFLEKFHQVLSDTQKPDGSKPSEGTT